MVTFQSLITNVCKLLEKSRKYKLRTPILKKRRNFRLKTPEFKENSKIKIGSNDENRVFTDPGGKFQARDF